MIYILSWRLWGFTPGYYLSRFQRSESGTHKIRQAQQFSVEKSLLKTENYFVVKLN
jgi:hypothetical protein